MTEGLWTIKFISSLNIWGGGVLVLIEGGRILGGDTGYYYIGTYKHQKDVIEGKADIIRFDPQSVSVFGKMPKFNIEFKGELKNNESEFSATATSRDFPGLSLRIEGNKKEDL